jgi:hypothetical protein
VRSLDDKVFQKIGNHVKLPRELSYPFAGVSKTKKRVVQAYGTAFTSTGWGEGFPDGPYPSETIRRNSCVKGFARMGTSMGPAALIAGVVMCTSIAA